MTNSSRVPLLRKRLGWSSLLIPSLFCGSFWHGTGSRNMTVQALELDSKLLAKAARVRQQWKRHRQIQGFADFLPDLDYELYVLSTYKISSEKMHRERQRGFCNWILPDFLMVGQYPCPSPEEDGPSLEDSEQHLKHILKINNEDATLSALGGIRRFVSLQSEIPPQDDLASWDRQEGMVFLPVGGGRDDFPHPFVHYAPLVLGMVPDCQFHHAPIEDLSVPNNQSLMNLLDYLLSALGGDKDNENKNEIFPVYLHCWGGRGRAGVVASCILALVFPDLEDADIILAWVQQGYQSRDGHADMPLALSRSPQALAQRRFVHSFVKQVQSQTQK